MKRLGLFRHAKAEEHHPSGHDFARALNRRGRRAAETMGRYIGKKVAGFDRLLTSPAVRVQETLEIALEAMGEAAPTDRVEDRRLYLSTSDSIDDVIADIGGEAENLLLVAHNPGLEDAVLDHVPNDGSCPLRAEVAKKFPTGTYAEIEFDIADWSEICGAQGRLVILTRPRDLDPTLGPHSTR